MLETVIILQHLIVFITLQDHGLTTRLNYTFMGWNM